MRYLNISQSVKHFNQNVNTGSNLSSSKYTKEKWAFNLTFKKIILKKDVTRIDAKGNTYSTTPNNTN